MLNKGILPSALARGRKVGVGGLVRRDLAPGTLSRPDASHRCARGESAVQLSPFAVRSPDCAVCHSFLPTRFSRPSLHDIPVPAGGRRGDAPSLGNANPDSPRQRSVSRSRPQGVSQPCCIFFGSTLGAFRLGARQTRGLGISPLRTIVRNLCSNNNRKGKGCQVIKRSPRVGKF